MFLDLMLMGMKIISTTNKNNKESNNSMKVEDR